MQTSEMPCLIHIDTHKRVAFEKSSNAEREEREGREREREERRGRERGGEGDREES